MDWGKLAGDFANFQEKASAKLSEVGDKAKEKIEEAKLRMQPPLTIGQYEVTIIKKLADGGFSEVFLAKSVENSEEKFALKRMICQNAVSKSDAKAELKILKAFSSHPNIITVLGGIARSMVVPGQKYESMEVHFLFPFYEEGTVFDVMWSALENQRKSNPSSGGFGSNSGSGGFGSDNVWPFPEVELVRVLGGVANALIAMHKKGYSHRDIKPHNILLGPRGGVLMDLGSAEPARRDIATKRDAMKVEDDAAIKCSAPYRAPELTEVRYPCSIDESVDVWSLGCTAYAMAFNAYSPFESDIEGVKRLAILNGKYLYPKGNRNECGSVYSNHFIELIDRCLQLDNTKRPTMTELKNCFDCLANKNALPPLVGQRPNNHGNNVEEDDAEALKIYLKHKETENLSSQRQSSNVEVVNQEYQQHHEKPPQVDFDQYQHPNQQVEAQAPVSEPNLLDFDSFQAPLDQVSVSTPAQVSNSTSFEEFGDFEGHSSSGGFGDFVSASESQSSNPTTSFDAFQSAPQQTSQQQQFQQPQFQQPQFQQQQQQQFQQPQFQQQQQYQPQSNSPPPPMNFSNSHNGYVDHFAAADNNPPPSSPYTNQLGGQGKKGLDAINPFDHM